MDICSDPSPIQHTVQAREEIKDFTFKKKKTTTFFLRILLPEHNLTTYLAVKYIAFKRVLMRTFHEDNCGIYHLQMNTRWPGISCTSRLVD